MFRDDGVSPRTDSLWGWAEISSLVVSGLVSLFLIPALVIKGLYRRWR